MNQIDQVQSGRKPQTFLGNEIQIPGTDQVLPEILFITSFPPRECGIATYSQDLIKALNNKFHRSFAIKICALESETEKHSYSDEIDCLLNTDDPNAFKNLAENINGNRNIRIVLIQHEFGFFEKKKELFAHFLSL